MFEDSLMKQIRDRFCHVDTCPYQGPRIFFENAGGALTLKSVVEVNTQLAGIPDNQGRDNPASQELVRIIAEARDNMRPFLGLKIARYLPVKVAPNSTFAWCVRPPWVRHQVAT